MTKTSLWHSRHETRQRPAPETVKCTSASRPMNVFDRSQNVRAEVNKLVSHRSSSLSIRRCMKKLQSSNRRIVIRRTFICTQLLISSGPCGEYLAPCNGWTVCCGRHWRTNTCLQPRLQLTQDASLFRLTLQASLYSL